MAYRSIGTYRGDGPLGGWLMRIATPGVPAPRSAPPDQRAAARRADRRAGPDPVAATLAGERQREIRLAVPGCESHIARWWPGASSAR